MSSEYEAPHLKLRQVTPLVIVVGDPFRVEILAKLCDHPKELAWNREYRSFSVTYKAVPLTICSHGIGGPGAAICFEELIKLGAKCIIRLGTCGSLQPDLVSQGDLVVSLAAAREDGHTEAFVPKGFPAVSDPLVALTLKQEAEKLQLPDEGRVFAGLTLTHAIFYPSPAGNRHLKEYADLGCLSVDMEISTLFVVCSVRGVKAGAMAVIDGSPFKWEEGNYDPHGTRVSEGKKRMFIAGLETIVAMNGKV